MRSRSGLWGYSPLRELLVSEVYMGIHAGGRDSLLKSSSTIIAPSYRRISIHGIDYSLQLAHCRVCFVT